MTGFVTYLMLFIFISFSTGSNNKINVGTVLFSDSDTTKDCWTTESIALITSRMMLEDVLPSKEVLIIKDSGFITDIINYFRLVLEVVRKVTYGKMKHVMLLALTDTLGGYLNHLIIPTARHAYYGGYIDFDSMEQLHELFDELKCFLRTNGRGWEKPVHEFSKKMDAEPLPMQSPAPKTDPCKGLVIYDKPARPDRKQCTLGIPMPFFDSKTKPSAIAVPFKTYSLRSIESKSASYVLVKFYMAATKCLAHRNADKKSMNEFNTEYLTWIHGQVLPHLNDDKFYSAFGGVLRVVETLGRLGVTLSGTKEMGHYNIMPEMQIKEYSKEVSEDEDTKRKKSNLILTALLATIFIWFLLGSMFICYRIRAAKSRQVDDCCCKPPDKSSSTSSSSKRPSKSSKNSSESKKPSTSSQTSRSKKTITSSNRASPAHSTGSGLSIASKETIPSQESGVVGSGRASPGGSCESKCSSSSGGSARSPSRSTSTRRSAKPVSKSKRQSGGSCSMSPCGGSIQSVGSKKSKRSAGQQTSKSSSASKKSSPEGSDRKKNQMYPASCACHTSISGKYRMSSSSEEQLRKEKQEPLVFGYELETSSSDTTAKDLIEEPEPK